MSPITRLFQFAWPQKKLLASGLVFLLIASSASLLLPQFVQQIIDQALNAKDLQVINRIAFWMLLIFVVQAFAAGVRYFLFTLAGERAVRNIRHQVFAAILHEEISFFDKTTTGELLSRLSSDCQILQSAVSVNISMALRNMALVLGGVALLIYTSPQLALVMLAVVIPIAIVTTIFGRRIRKLSRKAQDELAEAASVAEDSIASIRSLRAFNYEDESLKKYDQALSHYLGFAIKKLTQVSWFTILGSIFGYAAVVGVIWMGGRMILEDELSIGQLTSFVLYLITVAFSIAALTGLWSDWNSALGAAKRIFGILDDAAKAQPITPTLPIPQPFRGKIEFRHCSFSYPTRPQDSVIQNLSFQLPAGQKLAIVGPSGAGKSTIAALLFRFYEPSSGQILIDDQEISEMSATELRKHFALVEQEPSLFSGSVYDNILVGNISATKQEVIKAAQLANAHSFIEAFHNGYDSKVGERGIQLSGGQKQRIAIARAILRDPKILILDEATSALDAQNESLVHEALERAMHQRTTLIIAHRYSSIKAADQILLVQDGHVTETGRPDQLLENKNSQLFQLLQKQIISITA